MPPIATFFEKHGHSITHKWWELESIPESWWADEALEEQAYFDMRGVMAAERLVLINSSKSEGKAVEQGIALARGLMIIAVGTRGAVSKNVFHHLPNYIWVPTLEDVLTHL